MHIPPLQLYPSLAMLAGTQLACFFAMLLQLGCFMAAASPPSSKLLGALQQGLHVSQDNSSAVSAVARDFFALSEKPFLGIPGMQHGGDSEREKVAKWIHRQTGKGALVMWMTPQGQEPKLATLPRRLLTGFLLFEDKGYRFFGLPVSPDVPTALPNQGIMRTYLVYGLPFDKRRPKLFVGYLGFRSNLSPGGLEPLSTEPEFLLTGRRSDNVPISLSPTDETGPVFASPEEMMLLESWIKFELEIPLPVDQRESVGQIRLTDNMLLNKGDKERIRSNLDMLWRRMLFQTRFGGSIAPDLPAFEFVYRGYHNVCLRRNPLPEPGDKMVRVDVYSLPVPIISRRKKPRLMYAGAFDVQSDLFDHVVKHKRKMLTVSIAPAQEAPVQRTLSQRLRNR